MCPIGFLMLGSTLQDLPNDSPAACRSACRRQASLRTGSPNERSSRAPGLSWSATGSSWPLPNHLPRRRPSPNRNLRWPSTACASFEHEAPTQADHEPGMDTAGDHADPGHPSHRLPAHRRAPGPHSGRTQRTRQCSDTGRPHRTPDSGRPHRTPDSGHLDARMAPDTGHPSLGQASVDTGRSHRTPDTGHRTLAEDADRVTTARPASGPPRPPRRATARWDAQPCSCGRRLRALDSPCRLGGEAAFQREIASRRQLLGRSGGVERRLGALLSSDDFGSSVERTAKLHPLCAWS
jgi:hypothetical protein